jgi:hypothetical protein
MLGGIPGQLGRSTLGHAGQCTFCMAKDEEDSPGAMLAWEHGVPAGISTAIMLACEAPCQVMNEWTHHAQEILKTFAVVAG